MESQKINDYTNKYKALARYIKNYDYDNLIVLSFPKEDAKFLYMACTFAEKRLRKEKE